MKLKKSSYLIAGALLGALALPAQADDAMLDLLKVLRDKGTISSQDYELLKNAAAADQQAKEDVAKKLEKVEKESVNVKLDKGLKISSGDDAFEMKLGGRVMADYAWIDDDRDLDGNGSEFRRTRFFMSGKAFNDWKYKLQVDFAGNGVDLKDAYIGYTGFDNVDLTVGNHKMPFGLEELTSSKYITFMERSAPTGLFSPSRQNGLSVGTGGDNWSFKAAAHMQGIDNDNDDRDEDYGYGGRVTFAPLVNGQNIIHLGAAWHHQEYEKNGLTNGAFGAQRFRARPEIHTINTRPYDTTINGAEDSDTFGLEAAFVQGPFSMQAEYFTRDINTTTDDVDFKGYYVYGSWFLTGESRNYSASSGAFKRVTPNSEVGKGGSGAWELALRYSDLDLYDTANSVAAFGEEGDITTIGLNWYATRNIRLMANYTSSTVEYPGTNLSDDDIKAFQVRGQIDF